MLNAEFPSDFVGPLQPGDTRPMPAGSETTPQTITAWADAIFGTAKKGAETYQTVKDTVTGQQKVVLVSAPKNNTLLYIGVGLAALFLLGGGTYLLTKKKGR